MKKITICLALVIVMAAGAVQAQLLGPLIEVDPGSVDFGSVSTNEIKLAYLTVSNTGDGPLVIDAVKTKSPFWDNINRAITIQPGNSAVVTVAFMPQTPGVANSVCTFQSNAFNTPVLHIPLTGVGYVE